VNRVTAPKLGAAGWFGHGAFDIKIVGNLIYGAGQTAVQLYAFPPTVLHGCQKLTMTGNVLYLPWTLGNCKRGRHTLNVWMKTSGVHVDAIRLKSMEAYCIEH
jgi:hypothetical protein